MQLTYIRGTVTSRNANKTGVILDGSGDWFNLSKFAEPGVQLPAAGAAVILGLDSRGLVRSCEIESAPAVVTGLSNHAGGPSAPKVAPGATLTATDPVLRLSALRLAVKLLAGADRPATEGEALAIAERFLSWLALREERTPQSEDFRV